MYSADIVSKYLLELQTLYLPEIQFSSFSRSERARVTSLISFLEELGELEFRNSFLASALTHAKDLCTFLSSVKSAFQGEHRWRLWLERLPDETAHSVNLHLQFIYSALQSWENLVKEKSAELPLDNSHLSSLPQHSDPTHFFLMVKELAPDRVDLRHPFSLPQKKFITSLSTEQLLAFLPDDPISGHRVFRPQDNLSYPGSFIVIRQGHHRLYELYRRYLMGNVDGDTLVEVVIDYPSLKKG